MPYFSENLIVVDPVPALSTNYIWMIRHPDQGTIIVDPGESQPVFDYLKKHKTRPVAILITHHHLDHCGGVVDIVANYDIPVYGSAKEESAIDGLTHPVKDQQVITIDELELSFEIMAIPGHTLGHVAYYNAPWLFCGDTLFSAGCGRLFEGSASQLYYSLQSLATLPRETQVFCGHEYTQANLKFARHVEPHNENAQQYQQQVQDWQADDKPTLPSTIGLERAVNPFLRCQDSALIASAKERDPKLDPNDPVAVFKVLRDWKDKFKIGN